MRRTFIQWHLAPQAISKPEIDHCINPIEPLLIKNNKKQGKKTKNNEQVKGKSRDGVTESRCAGISGPWT